jgi:hypothetical protein
MPPFSGSKKNSSKQPVRRKRQENLLLGPENGGSVFLQNVGELSPDYMALHPRIKYFSQSPL